jgi:FAD/FMN-containing dehydrogenase
LQVSLAKTDLLDFWDVKQSSVQPACKVEPENAEDVAFIINTAVESQCHFAIKSGGHARDPEFSNADGGITIDLVRLGQIEIASDKKR